MAKCSDDKKKEAETFKLEANDHFKSKLYRYLSNLYDVNKYRIYMLSLTCQYIGL